VTESLWPCDLGATGTQQNELIQQVNSSFLWYIHNTRTSKRISRAKQLGWKVYARLTMVFNDLRDAWKVKSPIYYLFETTLKLPPPPPPFILESSKMVDFLLIINHKIANFLHFEAIRFLPSPHQSSRDKILTIFTFQLSLNTWFARILG